MTLDVMLLITKTYLISGYSLELQKTHLNQLRFTCDGDVDNMLVMCRKVGQKVRIQGIYCIRIRITKNQSDFFTSFDYLLCKIFQNSARIGGNLKILELWIRIHIVYDISLITIFGVFFEVVLGRSKVKPLIFVVFVCCSIHNRKVVQLAQVNNLFKQLLDKP